MYGNLYSVFLIFFSGKKGSILIYRLWQVWCERQDYGKFEKLSFTEILILLLWSFCLLPRLAKTWCLYLYLFGKKTKTSIFSICLKSIKVNCNPICKEIKSRSVLPGTGCGGCRMTGKEHNNSLAMYFSLTMMAVTQHIHLSKLTIVYT